MKILVVGDFQGVFPQKLKNKIRKEDFDLIVGVGDYGGIRDWRPWVMADIASSKAGNGRISAEDYFGKEKLKRIVKKDFEAAKKVLKELDGLKKKGVIVFGNGDDEWYSYPFGQKIMHAKKRNKNVIRKLKNLKDINYGSTKLKGISFVGFGGYMDIDSYFNKNEFKDAEDKDSLNRRKMRRKKSKNKFESLIKKSKLPSIFVFHYPPQGVFDIIRDKKDNPMNGKSAGIGFFTEAIKKHKPLAVFCGHMHEYRGMKKLHGIPVINPGDAEEGRAAIVEIIDKKIKVKFIK